MAQTRLFCTLGLGTLVGALVAAGCGSSSIGGGSGGTGGTGGIGATGGGGTVDCAPLVANAETTPVTVRFVNDTAGDLYVRFPTYTTCGDQTTFTITGPGNEDLPFRTDSCNTTCASAACTCTVTYTCFANAPLTRVTAHGAAVIQWSGGVLENRTVPIACMAGGSCYGAGPETAPCQSFIEPKAYPLSFSANAWTDLSCTGDGCTCTPDASGSCALAGYAAAPAGTTVHGTGSLSKGATSVDIVFQ